MVTNQLKTKTFHRVTQEARLLTFGASLKV